MKQFLRDRINTTNIVILSFFVIACTVVGVVVAPTLVKDLSGAVVYPKPESLPEGEAQQQMRLLADNQRSYFKAEGLYAFDFSWLPSSSRFDDSITLRTSQLYLEECYGAFAQVDDGSVLYVSSEKAQPVKIEADEEWPKARPTDYPESCYWPSSRELSQYSWETNFMNYDSSYENELDVAATYRSNTTTTSTIKQSETADSGFNVLSLENTEDGEPVEFMFTADDLFEDEYVVSFKVRSTDPVEVTPSLEEGSSAVVVGEPETVVASSEWQIVHMKIQVDQSGSGMLIAPGFTTNGVADGMTIEVDSLQISAASEDIKNDLLYTGD
jgi:hypothetical protein